MTRLAATRGVLVLLAVSAFVPGLWATLAPRGFFDDFPGPGAGSWVAALPPYNDHLTSDVGAFYLAFAVLFAWGAWRPARALVVPVASAWALFSALHLVFHVRHLDGFATGDAIAQTAALALVLVATVALVRLSGSPA